MSNLAIANPNYISQPIEINKINKSALIKVSLLHATIALLLFGSWSASKHPSAAVKTINIQMYTMPKPIVQPLQTVIPAEPVVEIIEAKPEVKPNIVKHDLAFERVKKVEPKVKPKPFVKKKAPPKAKPVPKDVAKLKELKKPTAETSKATATETQKITRPAAKSTQQQSIDNSISGNAQKIEQYLPIDKTAPNYPKGAIRKNLEGDCTVQYDVNTQGRVESPTIVGKCHPLFKRPSLAAAKKFRYKPRIIDGQAVVVKNVKNTFEYRIK